MTLTEHALTGATIDAGPRERLAVGLPWYRSMPLSSFVAVEVHVDGTRVQGLALELGDEVLPVAVLAAVVDRYWFVQDRHVLNWRPALAAGVGEAEVVLRVRLHLPFLTGPDGASVQVLQEVRGDRAGAAGGVSAARARWAVTLFSFTNELLEATATSDELLRDLLRSGATTTVEIDAAQHLRSFPVLDPEEVRRTAEHVRAEGGSVSLLGGGADVSPAPGVALTEDGVLEQLRAQIEAAAILGAEGVRVPFSVLPWALLQRAARHAEEAGVLLLEEVQGPEDPAGPRVQARVADLERTGERWIRLLLDTSTLMSGLPPTYVDALRRAGLGWADAERLAVAFRERRLPPEVLPRLADAGTSPVLRGLLVTAMTRFGSRTAADWLPLAPWISSIHLKWWDAESVAADLAGELGLLLDGLIRAGFTGALCSEWGGHEWESSSVSAIERTRLHRRLLEERFGSDLVDFGMKTT